MQMCTIASLANLHISCHRLFNSFHDILPLRGRRE